MEDRSIEKERFIKELDELKKIIAKLEVSEDMHKWTETKLQREGYEKEILLNNTSAMIYWLDGEGKYIIVNKCFADLFNKSPDEIKGKVSIRFIP